MGELFRRGVVTFMAGLVAATLAWPGLAQAQSEPPGRVGRLAFTDGTVSFHDAEQNGWSPAVVNTPLSTGDSLWTEPNARSEISLAGTRIRMAGATQLDMLAVDDTQTRLQVDQGRIDVKTVAMDTHQPYQIVTPRGTISLQQQGDYYVEAGSTEDPTRLGVRSGAAQIQDLNGQVLAVRAGEVGEVLGDAGAPQLRTIHTAPPPMPAAWADRDRQVVYDQPPQYLTADVTGYEDLNGYGSWMNDGSYGEVWVPRSVPSGWAPYRTGHWAYVQPWGWTWIDDQPWGFAPYHYGRWAHRDDRWMWVPPQREVRPVYAPALVAFVGGIELAAALSNPGSAPVGWFPLGPREAYVPPYTSDRDYYQRINRPARIEDQVLAERWQRAERHEAFVAGQNSALMNQRFATVVPATAFVRSQPVMRAALQVPPDKIAAAPVAPVAAPPAPTASVATAAPATAPAAAARPAATTAPAPAANLAVAKTAVADMPTLAKPAAVQAPAAPGPKLAATQPAAPTTDKSKPAVPALAPRQGAAPPELKGAVVPAPTPPARPGEPPKQQQAAPQPHAVPPAAPSAAPAPSPQQQARPEPAKPADAPRQQAAPPPPVQHPQPPPQANAPQHPAEPPRQQATQPPVQPNQPPHPAEAPRPQAVPQPQPPHQPAQEGHAAPPPQQQPHPAPQPQQVQAPHPAPPPQQPVQQPHPAPPPQQAQAPHPAPPPPQAQAPHPAPPPQPQQHEEKK